MNCSQLVKSQIKSTADVNYRKNYKSIFGSDCRSGHSLNDKLKVRRRRIPTTKHSLCVSEV